MPRVARNRSSARARVHSAGVRQALARGAQQGLPAAPQQLQSQAGQAPTVQGATDPYDFSADPILQRVQALGARRTAEAEAAALAARRQLAIDTGDVSLAPDEETRQQALNNPFSVRAQFEKKAHDQPLQLAGQLSQQNLGYSSAGATQQSNLATSLLGEQASNQATERQALSGIEEALRQAREGAQNDITAAQEDAAARLQQRLGDTPVGYQGVQDATPIHGAEGIAAEIGRRFRNQGQGRTRVRHVPAHLPGHRP